MGLLGMVQPGTHLLRVRRAPVGVTGTNLGSPVVPLVRANITGSSAVQSVHAVRVFLFISGREFASP